MGLDEDAAKDWGKKEVDITFNEIDVEGKFDAK